MGHSQQLTALRRQQERRRLQAVAMFEQGVRQVEVVNALHVSPSAVSKWHSAWQAGGAEALSGRRNPGRPAQLSPEQLQLLEHELLKGPRAHGYETELWTLSRVGRLIHKLFGVTYHDGHVWRVLGRMGWSCQKPARRAKQRNEDAIQGWRKEQWPAIKKGQWPQEL